MYVVRLDSQSGGAVVSGNARCMQQACRGLSYEEHGTR